MTDDDDDSDEKLFDSSEKTPKDPVRVEWSDERRAHVNRKHRRVMTDSEKRRRVEGVPVQPFDEYEQVTSPTSILDHAIGPEDIKHIERLRRETDDPYVLAFKLAKALKLITKREETGERERETQLATAIKTHEEKLDAIDAKFRWARNLAAAALTLALSGIGGIIGKIWDRSGDERETVIQLREVKQETERHRDDTVRIRILEQEVERLRDHLPPPFPTQKDKP